MAKDILGHIRLAGIRVRTAHISKERAKDVLICLWCRHCPVIPFGKIIQAGLWGNEQIIEVCWCDWCHLASVFVISNIYQAEEVVGKKML